jgi:hypothetical protein
MANVGRLTGQILLALGRDNIPMMQALEKAFGKTGAEIRTAISSGAIDAQTAITALINYTQTTPGYINKAAEFSKHSLTGAFSTFKDLVRMAFGSSQQGLFDAALKRLNAVNQAILPLVSGKKPITILNLATALDKALTPSTHGVLNAFELINGALQAMIFEFGLLAKFVGHIFTAFNNLIGVFGGSRRSANAFGYVLGTIITLFIIGKSVIIAEEVATVAWMTVKIAATAALWLFNFALAFTIGEEMTAAEATTAYTLAMLAFRGAVFEAVGALATFIAANALLFGIAAIFLVIIGALVILYFRWKPFRDLVNETATWFWKNWQYAGLLFAFLIPGLGLSVYLIGLVVKNWNAVKSAVDAVVGAVRTLFNWILKLFNINIKHGVSGILGSLGKDILNIGTGGLYGAASSMFHFQAGGIMPGTGMAVVGEHGPEIVHLPAGSRISPRPNTDSIFDPQATSSQPITIQLVLNRRVLEEAVVDIQQRRNAHA